MTPAAGLIASRFLHFAALMLLFGAALFPLYAYRDDAAGAVAELWPRLRRILLAAAIIAFVSALSWLAFTSASMSGSLSGAGDMGIIQTVMEETEFGRVWVWRLGLALIAILLLLPARRREWLVLAQIAVAAVLLTTIAGTGHAASDDTMLGTGHILADGLHLLTAAAWLGGLVPLMLVLSLDDRGAGAAKIAVLDRFSSTGTIAVAILLASGLVNSLSLVGSFDALFASPYGRWLMLKIALFLAMVVLACLNRFWLVPRLKTSGGQEPVLKQLKSHVLAEQVLGILVLAVVSLLGTLAPATG